MFDRVRASILFDVSGTAPMDEVVKVVHQGFEAVQSDGSSRLEHFEVAASQMSRKIVVDVELQVRPNRLGRLKTMSMTSSTGLWCTPASSPGTPITVPA